MNALRSHELNRSEFLRREFEERSLLNRKSHFLLIVDTTEMTLCRGLFFLPLILLGHFLQFTWHVTDLISASAYRERSASITDAPENFVGEDESDGEDEPLEAEFLDREHLRTIIAQDDPHLLRGIGHQFEDFVVYCTFRGFYCA